MQVPSPVQVDLPSTRRRIAKLRRYVEGNLLRQDTFVCPHYEACRDSRRAGDVFREGTMSHVGRHLDLVLGGKPLRVVVVGQESGVPKDPRIPLGTKITLDARYAQIHDGTGLQKRYYAEEGHAGRSPHMRGTTSALRVIFGKGLGADHLGEFVHPTNGRQFHIFDGFALVNRLLCSAGPPQSNQGRPTPTMFSQCGRHFAATLSILEPTVVILQGKAVAKWADNIFVPVRTYGEHLHEARLDEQRILVCSFSHPSARGRLGWGGRLDSAYLNEVIAPTLREAVRRS